MMQEASKRRCNKTKFISLSFVSKLFSQKILIQNIYVIGHITVAHELEFFFIISVGNYREEGRLVR